MKKRSNFHNKGTLNQLKNIISKTLNNLFNLDILFYFLYIENNIYNFPFYRAYKEFKQFESKFESYNDIFEHINEFSAIENPFVLNLEQIENSFANLSIYNINFFSFLLNTKKIKSILIYKFNPSVIDGALIIGFDKSLEQFSLYDKNNLDDPLHKIKNRLISIEYFLYILFSFTKENFYLLLNTAHYRGKNNGLIFLDKDKIVNIDDTLLYLLSLNKREIVNKPLKKVFNINIIEDLKPKFPNEKAYFAKLLTNANLLKYVKVNDFTIAGFSNINRVIHIEDVTEKFFNKLLKQIIKILYKTNVSHVKKIYESLELIKKFFDADLVFLSYPLDLTQQHIEAKFEVHSSEYLKNYEYEKRAEIKDFYYINKLTYESSSPVFISIDDSRFKNLVGTKKFNIKSQVTKALSPKYDKKWLFGVCFIRTKRKLTKIEISIFESISKILEQFIENLNLLRETEYNSKLYKSLFDSTPLPTLIIDDNLNILNFNNTFQKYLEFNERENIKYKFEDLLQLYDLPSKFSINETQLINFNEKNYTRVDIPKLLRTKNLVDRYFIVKLKNNKSFIAELKKRIIYFEDKVLYLLTFIDQTESIFKDLNLLQSQKLESIGRLVTSISHEFNNILTIITGNLYVFKKNILPYLKRDETFSNIYNEVLELLEDHDKTIQRAQNLTANLLTFSKVKPFHNEIIDIDEYFKNEIKIFKKYFSGKKVEIEYLSEPTEKLILIDKNNFTHVVINIVINAVDAMENNTGKISIITSKLKVKKDDKNKLKSNNFIVIEFKDNGCGIPDNILPKIFDPFFTTKDPTRGTGLGLAIVKNIIEKYNGFIEVESEVGKGTNFKIYLPEYIEKKRGKRKIAKKIDILNEEELLNLANKIQEKVRTIFIIDDEPSIVKYLKLVLEEFGFKVYIAIFEDEFNNIIKNHKNEIDFVILDLLLLNMDFDNVIQNITSNFKGKNIIYMTGYYEAVEKYKKYLTPSSIYLFKPFTVMDLLKSIYNSIYY